MLLAETQGFVRMHVYTASLTVAVSTMLWTCSHLTFCSACSRSRQPQHLLAAFLRSVATAALVDTGGAAPQCRTTGACR